MASRFGGLGIQKHSNRSFYHPGAWPQDVKTFEFEVLGSKNLEFEGFNILGSSVELAGCEKLRFGMVPRFGGLGIQKHLNWSFYHPGAWPLDAKTFEFEVFGPQDLEFEAFNTLGSCPMDSKSFDLDVLDPQTSK